MWQTASDFIIFIGWLWHFLITLGAQLFLPVRYIFTFLASLLVEALATPQTADISVNVPYGVVLAFQAVPGFNFLISAVIIAVSLIFLGFILDVFLKT